MNQRILLGRVSAFGVSIILALYVPVLILGLASLKSPSNPISDPYFSIMELLILLVAPLMVVCMIAVYEYASKEDKMLSLTALVFMTIMAVITSSVHFTVLTVSRQIEAAGFSWAPLFFSFKWPSIIYTLDILAWDWFFALSMIFAAPVFKRGKLEKVIRSLMIVSGVLSLVGLIGVPLANNNVEYWANVRNIGIVGYSVVALPTFLLMGILFGLNNNARNKSKK